MKVEAFLLCDAATEQQGKLNILGAFDCVSSKKLPGKHSHCAIVARIRFEKVEEGEHPIRIYIIDEDGKSIGPKLEGNVNVRIGEDRDSGVKSVVLNVQKLKFEKYGWYRIELFVDGKKKGFLPFVVKEWKND